MPSSEFPRQPEGSPTWDSPQPQQVARLRGHGFRADALCGAAEVRTLTFTRSCSEQRGGHRLPVCTAPGSVRPCREPGRRSVLRNGKASPEGLHGPSRVGAGAPRGGLISQSLRPRQPWWTPGLQCSAHTSLCPAFPTVTPLPKAPGLPRGRAAGLVP